MSAPRSRPELRRLPFGTRVLYGVGSMANASLLQTGGLVLLFYNQIVGLNAALAGLALAICTFVDAFWDPLVGWFSDHLGSRLGRRHPLMYLSAVPVSLTAVLVFDPPRGLSQAGLFGWLLVTVMACRMSISLYEVPSGALAPELAPEYHDRTRLLGYRWLLGAIGGAIAAVLIYGIFLARTARFPQGQLNPAGYAPMAASIAALIFVSIIVSTVGTQGEVKRLHRPSVSRPGVLAAAREVVRTLGNRNFLVAVVAGIVAAVSTSVGGGLLIYYGTYFWALPSESILVLILTGLISTPIAVAIAPIVSRRWGKKISCMSLFFASVITNNGPIVLRLLGVFPPNGSPLLLPILTATTILTGVLGTGGFILVTSMIADIVEEVQVATGRRSEGLLFSADSLINKVVVSFGTVIPGLLLAYVGFPTHARPAHLDPAIMRHLATIAVPLTAGFSTLSIACWAFYRIDEASHARDLETIAAAAAAPPSPPGLPGVDPLQPLAGARRGRREASERP